MKDADKNRDPERARKRAVADLRCAARKIGIGSACRALLELAADEAGMEPDQLLPGNHSVVPGIGRRQLAGLILAGDGLWEDIDWEVLVT